MKPSNWRKFKRIWIILVRCWVWSSLLKFHLWKPLLLFFPLKLIGLHSSSGNSSSGPQDTAGACNAERIPHFIAKPHLKWSHRVATSWNNYISLWLKSLQNENMKTLKPWSSSSALHCHPAPPRSALTCSHTSNLHSWNTVPPPRGPASGPPRGLSALRRCKYGEITHGRMCAINLSQNTPPIIRGYGCNLRSAKLLFEVNSQKESGSEQGEGECCANLLRRSSQKTSGIFALAGYLRWLI